MMSNFGLFPKTGNPPFQKLATNWTARTFFLFASNGEIAIDLFAILGQETT
jgi:hypothetical protein